MATAKETNEATVQTQTLLEQREALAQATRQQIERLLKEREDRIESHANRLAEIAVELKDLGYHAPRKPRAKNSSTNGA